MGFFAVVVVLCLIATAGFYGKPWVDLHLLLHRDHPKKREEENASACDDGGVEIIVNESADTREADNVRRPPVPVASALPARLARQQLGSPLGPMEASIRTALRELRSRQVVKTICSKFESRMATAKASLSGDGRAMTEFGDDDRSARPVQYQPLLPRQEASVKPLEKPQSAANPPAPRHSLGGAVPAQRSNNLNAFLRRYSSNLEKAAMETQTTTSSESRSQDAKRASDSEVTEKAIVAPAIASVPTLTQPAIMTPCEVDSDLEDDFEDLKLQEAIAKEVEASDLMPAPLLNLRLDIEPIVAISDDDPSNQCDSLDDANDGDKKQAAVDPLESSKGSDNNDQSPRSRLAQWTASRIPAPSVHSLSRSSFTGEASTQRKQLQSPEKASRSVARLQQFRQQVPANVYSHLE